MAITKIAQVDVGAGGAASIDFTSIPNTFTDVMVVLSGRSAFGDISASTLVTINSDTGANYTRKWLIGNGSAASSATGSTSYFLAGYVPAATSTANTFGNIAMFFPNYAGSSAKSMTSDAVMENNATFSYQVLSAYSWTGTAAITSISIKNTSTSNWVQYSSATLYGISKSGATGATVA